jgi:hypothetical protein
MRMRLARIVLLSIAAMSVSAAELSDPIGVYALIDRVVFLPNAEHAETIRIYGAFSVSVPQRGGREGAYAYMLGRGYLLYSIEPGRSDATPVEWRDLASMAGTDAIVAFGARRAANGRIRHAGEPEDEPDRYPIGFGVVRGIRTFAFEHRLRSIPAVVSPQDGATVEPGPVRLVARVPADTSRLYVFEIEADGVKHTSPPMRATDSELVWQPEMTFERGSTYLWRIRWAEAEGPRDAATFRIGGRPSS